ncbi:MAG: hypothetical protein M1825_003596 [Sarcosagium campestre]|nr:MAG: hypothetical protein M1825_003596 [Sarcosagium campestre]
MRFSHLSLALAASRALASPVSIISGETKNNGVESAWDTGFSALPGFRDPTKDCSSDQKQKLKDAAQGVADLSDTAKKVVESRSSDQKAGELYNRWFANGNASFVAATFEDISLSAKIGLLNQSIGDTDKLGTQPAIKRRPISVRCYDSSWEEQKEALLDFPIGYHGKNWWANSDFFARATKSGCNATVNDTHEQIASDIFLMYELAYRMQNPITILQPAEYDPIARFKVGYQNHCVTPACVQEFSKKKPVDVAPVKDGEDYTPSFQPKGSDMFVMAYIFFAIEAKVQAVSCSA